MTYLHQIIAIERGAAADAEKRLAQVKHVLAVGGEQNPLTGISRVYEPKQEDGDQYPPESRRVQVTVAGLVSAVSDSLVRLFDLKFTKEYANCSARADVVVDGQTIATDVPAGYLLFLENQVQALITGLLNKLPVLDPAQEWVNSDTDPNLPRGVWRTEPKKIEKTKRMPKFQVMVDPTPHHRAEIRQWETDEIEGYRTQIRYSGELPAREADEIRARAGRLLDAVRSAREEANRLEVANRQAGDKVLGYIFGDLAS